MLACPEEPTAPSIRDVAKLESQLDKLERDLVDVNNNRLNLKRRLLELTELRSILKYADQFFAEAQSGPGSTAEDANKKMMRRMSVMDPSLMRRFSMQLSSIQDSQQQHQLQDINIPLDPVVDMLWVS